MASVILNIAQVSNKGNKFAIVCGKAILGKFNSLELAKKQLESNREYYEYWAGSASTSIINSDKIIILC